MIDPKALPDSQVPGSLNECEARLHRAGEVADLLTPLYAHAKELDQTGQACRAAYDRRQADVDALKKRSLRVLWLSVRGKLDSRKDQADFALHEAAKALDANAVARRVVGDRIAELESERDSLGEAQTEYDDLLARFIALVADGTLPPMGDPARITAEAARQNALYKQYASAEDTAGELICRCERCEDALLNLTGSSRYIFEHRVQGTSSSHPLVNLEDLRPWEAELENVREALNDLDGRVRAFSSGDCIVPTEDLPRISGDEMYDRVCAVLTGSGSYDRVRKTVHEAEKTADAVCGLRVRLKDVAETAKTGRTEALTRRIRAMQAKERYEDSTSLYT